MRRFLFLFVNFHIHWKIVRLSNSNEKEIRAVMMHFYDSQKLLLLFSVKR
jgi:hypothetical protein